MKLKDHGEDWYRIHVYGGVFDKVFMNDDEFESKRSECYSRTTSVLKETDNDIQNQKIDFILRDINSDSDIVTVEEIPGRKGVKADVKKGFLFQKLSLKLWEKKINSSLLVQQLESVSCQWEKTKLTIYASRLLPSGGVLSYRKGEFAMPINSKHASEFAKLLLGVLSLKRLVINNYEKFNFILAERYNQEVDYLQFGDYDEFAYRDDSSDESSTPDQAP